MCYIKVIIKPEYVHIHGECLICDCMKIDDEGVVSLKNDGRWSKSLFRYCIDKIITVETFCY